MKAGLTLTWGAGPCRKPASASQLLKLGWARWAQVGAWGRGGVAGGSGRRGDPELRGGLPRGSAPSTWVRGGLAWRDWAAALGSPVLGRLVRPLQSRAGSDTGTRSGLTQYRRAEGTPLAPRSQAVRPRCGSGLIVFL